MKKKQKHFFFDGFGTVSSLSTKISSLFFFVRWCAMKVPARTDKETAYAKGSVLLVVSEWYHFYNGSERFENTVCNSIIQELSLMFLLNRPKNAFLANGETRKIKKLM